MLFDNWKFYWLFMAQIGERPLLLHLELANVVGDKACEGGGDDDSGDHDVEVHELHLTRDIDISCGDYHT